LQRIRDRQHAARGISVANPISYLVAGPGGDCVAIGRVGASTRSEIARNFIKNGRLRTGTARLKKYESQCHRRKYPADKQGRFVHDFSPVLLPWRRMSMPSMGDLYVREVSKEHARMLQY
jgi:hypothetical protein